MKEALKTLWPLPKQVFRQIVVKDSLLNIDVLAFRVIYLTFSIKK
jgi:hypothetical protein